MYLQWDNPFYNTPAGSLDDLNMYLLDCDQTLLATAEIVQGAGCHPLEVLRYFNATGNFQSVRLMLEASVLRSGGYPIVEMIIIGGYGLEYITPADSIYGHPGMPGVIGVGAVAVTSPTVIEEYSSRGPVTISHPAPETRAKPDLVATDCVQTGVVGFATFCGTSAAAPHIAALAALLLEERPEATPAQIQEWLMSGAVDLGVNGFDTVFGAGRADAMHAVEASRALTVRAYLPLIVR